MQEQDGKQAYLPTLKFVYSLSADKNPFKKIVVDQGAVKFMISGANVMRPGIVSFDEGIVPGCVVLIADEKGRWLAVGLSLVSSEEMKGMKSGPTVKNIHYLNDEIWKM